MPRSKALGNLPQSAAEDIAKYRRTHSLNETAVYIKEKYGIDVSYVTVKNYLEVNWRQISQKEIRLAAEAYDGILRAIDEYNRLLVAAANNKSMKIKVLKDYGRFLSDIFSKIHTDKVTVKESKEEIKTAKLDWQTDLDGKV